MTNHTEKARELRRNSTEAEKKLWQRIRNRQLGYKFRRQHPIPPYTVDFFCEELGLIIEVDGGQHNPEVDEQRNKFLEKQEYKILRFWNNEIFENIEGVLETINDYIPPHPDPYPGERENQANKQICLGKIAGAHGVKGMVEIIPYGEDLSLLEKAANLRIKIHKSQGKHILAQVEGITDREAALEIKGTEIFIDRADLPQTEEEEYYFEDLKGLEVRDSENKECGRIAAVQDFGASPLLEIRPLKGKTWYLPFTKEYVPEVNIAEDFVTISPPEGLID
jgi:16S rRNA processing protein RimM